MLSGRCPVAASGGEAQGTGSTNSQRMSPEKDVLAVRFFRVSSIHPSGVLTGRTERITKSLSSRPGTLPYAISF